MRKFGLTVVVVGLAFAGGCSSGGGGLGVSPGHGSPKAALDGFLTDLESSSTNDAWCDYIDPTGQSECRQALGEGADFHVTGTFAFGNQVIEGDEALVVITGNACLKIEDDSTTSTNCGGNTDQNAGLPSGAQSFSQAYSNALGSSSFATAACIEVNGQWYVNSQIGGGSASATSPTTVPTIPATTETTTPTSTPATTTPVTSPPTTTPATTDSVPTTSTST
jgi:hypothetical protein